LPAKITSPVLPVVFARTRLLRELDRKDSHPLVWIVGPPGAGKTTLVASYLNRRKSPHLWYQVDGEDSDVATLFHYLNLALQRQQPQADLPRLSPDRLAGLDAFVRDYFQALTAALGPAGTLVFDNYQDAPLDARLHEILAGAAGLLPRGSRLIVISRSEPPGAYARLLANCTMAVIGGDELRLEADEARGIARLRHRSDELRQILPKLHELTRGWAAGLVLLLEELRLGRTPLLVPRAGSPGAIFDYFAGEIFRRTDPDTQNVLLRSALLPVMTVRTVHELTGERRAGRILNALNRNNYFTQRQDLPEPVFQYHPLFREFLRNEAQRRLPAEDLRRLQQRAAALLEAEGNGEEAIALLQQIGDWPRKTSVIQKLAPALLTQGRGATLAQWIEDMPAGTIEASPWLGYWLGCARLASHPVEARQHLEAAYARFETTADVPGSFLAAAAIIDSHVIEFGDFTPLDRWIGELERLVSAHPRLPTPSIETRVACRLFLAMIYRQPQHPDLPRWEERVWRIVLESDDVELRVFIGAHLLLYYTSWTGQLRRGEIILDTLRPLAGQPGVSPLARITLGLIQSVYYWVSGDSQRALDDARTALALARDSGIRAWQVFLGVQTAMAALSLGDRPAARAALAEVAPHLDLNRYLDSAVYYHGAGWLAQADGDPAGQLEKHRLGLELAERSGSPFFVALELIELNRALRLHGLPASAAGKDRAEAIARAMRSNSLDHLAALAEAESALIDGNAAACREPIRRAFFLARQHGAYNHSHWRTDTMSRLCALALEHDIESDYARELVRRRQLPPPSDSQAPEQWPWRFRLYTLGRFALVRDGEPVAFTGKTQRKPLDLLRALVALGGRGVSVSLLAEVLWPDAEGDLSKHNLDTTLYRLRRLAGADDIVIFQDSRLTLNPGCCWVDVWALERLLNELPRQLQQGLPPTVLLDGLQRCCQGDFLSGSGEGWVLHARDQLRGKVLRAIVQLGEALERGNHWARAIDLYLHGLRLDPIAEELYQRLMRGYGRLQQPAEALRLYQQCRRTLKDMLGISPSEGTERLHRELRARQPA
jgi:ATP/maltotriose-dependent transcriptional regulator MalT/DNA-binding SARP family transcriptional activator